MNKAVVCEIEKYATHDGPGIRTVVFLKGCPLKCIWCANPETQRKENDIYYNENKCIKCKRCINSCNNNAIIFKNNKVVINRNKCILCGECIKTCLMSALNFVGKERDVKEVFDEVYKDNIFYKQSGGGVTISGGEVLMNSNFVLELLNMCKENYINTAIETSGFGDFNDLKNIANLCDTVMFDIKSTDDNMHKKFTGASNKIILDNLKKLSKIHHNIIIRIPVITGLNDNEENISKTADIALENDIKEIHLLPYHSLGKDKYRQLQRDYKLKELKNLNEIDIEHLKNIVQNKGLKCVISG